VEVIIMAVVRTPDKKFVTITGRVYVVGEGYQRLVYLAHKYRDKVRKAVKLMSRGLGKAVAEEILTEDMNQGYAKAAVDIAELIIEGARYHNSNPLKSKIKKLFIASKGRANFKGNQNIRLLATDKLIVRYPFKRLWIECSVRFGGEYLPLIRYIVNKALDMRLSYSAKIIFRNGKIYLHLSVPTWIYIEYFRKGHALGNNIASFDLNSDRINMVIVDRQGIIKDTKTEWYPEVNRPGYPRNKAWPLRLNALGRLLRYAYYHNVDTVLFEDLDRIKRNNKKTNSKNANRKMNRFPKRKLLEHATLMAMKYGFKVYLVSPGYTSKLAERIRDWFGLDIHTISAYTLALKYLNKETFKKLLNKDFQRRLLTK
jgi:IS605 OrfB family transposase